jgi:hypothetical protein
MRCVSDAAPAPVRLSHWPTPLDPAPRPAAARTVVVAVGSGGTMAGLVAGLGADRVLGVDTGAVPDPAHRVRDLVTRWAAPCPSCDW